MENKFVITVYFNEHDKIVVSKKLTPKEIELAIKRLKFDEVAYMACEATENGAVVEFDFYVNMKNCKGFSVAKAVEPLEVIAPEVAE